MPPNTQESRPKNRLAGSRSVYLQQHAHNPVQWWPWGADAIAHARERRVPLLVSIGYSTCYWCHVMERECFESDAIAAVLNRVCLPIKVDREERPDIDEVMMTACQVFTQLTEGRPSGGWPLNVFLDCDTLQPFFCGTYFPPEPAYGRVSFPQLLEAVDSAWQRDREGLGKQAAQLAQMVSTQLGRGQTEGSAPLDVAATVESVATALMRMYDAGNGGFGGAPKFPTPSYPKFLLATRADHPGIERALRHTLDAMATGGIFDQVGGGFHRYAVDAQWTVPHFEKMLYDNAQLAVLYARAAEKWGDTYYEQIVHRTLTYVQREMTGEHGQFFSAQDAEVGAREGGNYVWTPDEICKAMPESLSAFALRVYGVDGGPNFVDPHHSDAPPSNVLRLKARPNAMEQQQLDAVNAALLSARAKRPQPLTDDKTIASWTGLMIEAFAVAGRVFQRDDYTAAAARAADFVMTHMRSSDGGLLRIWRAGHAAVPAFLDDYANMCNGLLAIGGAQHSRVAEQLAEMAFERFAPTGAWFDVAEGQNELWVRPQDLDDGAVPCGTSSMLRALIALGGVHQQRARALLDSVAPAVREQPVTASGTVLAAWNLANLSNP